jgi:hypothetical protein
VTLQQQSPGFSPFRGRFERFHNHLERALNDLNDFPLSDSASPSWASEGWVAQMANGTREMSIDLGLLVRFYR